MSKKFEEEKIDAEELKENVFNQGKWVKTSLDCLISIYLCMGLNGSLHNSRIAIFI